MCCMAAIVEQQKDMSVHISFLDGFASWAIAYFYLYVFGNQFLKLALCLVVVWRIHKLLNFGQWY
jgi:hypothetical protein